MSITSRILPQGQRCHHTIADNLHWTTTLQRLLCDAMATDLMHSYRGSPTTAGSTSLLLRHVCASAITHDRIRQAQRGRRHRQRAAPLLGARRLALQCVFSDY